MLIYKQNNSKMEQNNILIKSSKEFEKSCADCSFIFSEKYISKLDVIDLAMKKLD